MIETLGIIGVALTVPLWSPRKEFRCAAVDEAQAVLDEAADAYPVPMVSRALVAASRGDADAVMEQFDRAAAWAKKHDRPVFLGEFGAYDKADMDSRARYTAPERATR